MRKLAVIFIVVILFKLLMLILLGSYFIRSANRSVGEPPDFLQAELVDIEGIKGWFVRANMPTRKCIVLMHGVRSDRRSMIKRAKFLKAKGYSSLLFDFQAHGETKGEFITFGYKEARNAEKVVSYTKALKECSRVGIIGQSLGGAASLLGKAPLSADALVLEAVYPDIEAAITNRLVRRLGPMGKVLIPFLVYQIPLRLKIPLQSLRPVEKIQELSSPVLIVAGSNDKHTLLSESKALFELAPEPKELYIVDNAEHVDFHSFSKEQYEKKILKFFEEHL